MKFRWLIKKYPEGTCEEIDHIYGEDGICCGTIKRRIKKPSTRELQYFVPPIKGSGAFLEEGYWITVPEVIEEVESL